MAIVDTIIKKVNMNLPNVRYESQYVKTSTIPNMHIGVFTICYVTHHQQAAM